eukprot:CAMPEP_0119042540 /NCGR_PEP_ID=MMETSP1177-20130426/15816_1 /TAXON_ID=2985 /ORGANISM="Ochromonas sp, Strain CCMP1899" /LENGTH=208 /DNA_ID=CAMNT_0007009423 /DNA_START=81 /DNA_END=707 /DNA_ORIENTATION=+
MSSPKEVAAKLLISAKENKVRFPKVWEESRLLQDCFATLMLHKEDGVFNAEAALAALIEKYGQEATTAAAAVEKIFSELDTDEKVEGEGDKKKRKPKAKKADEEEELDEDGQKIKKVKAPDTVANEANREIASIIKEIGVMYFKIAETMKGGVFSKGAMAIRQCETPITNKKEALALKGVGKGIAGYIEEFLATGVIIKLEELRAGTA